MAKQKGNIRIKGTIDDLTFYKLHGKDFVKSKSSLTKTQIDTNPNFVRTRENMSEFSTSAKDGKLLREALHVYMANAKDNLVTSRLLKTMRAIVKLDPTSLMNEIATLYLLAIVKVI
jgi:hypothetical protein